MTPVPAPQPQSVLDLTSCVIVDAANNRTLNDLVETALQYQEGGVETFFATNPDTGHVCLYQRVVAS